MGRAASLVAVAFLLEACVTFNTPVIPYFGSGFNQTTAPVDTTFRGETIGPRVGRSGAVSILGLFSFGDCSVRAAAASGQIARVTHIDCRLTNILGIYVAYETIVSGFPAEDVQR